jgi:hypothetical protein
MILVDCSELSADEKLALASQISDTLEGVAVALVKDNAIVFDQLTAERIDPSAVKDAVAGFISRRKDAEHYSVEVVGERIIVHSADPVSAMSRKTQNMLPPNLHPCHYCAFVTEYEEELRVHERTHLFGA